jgi:hypothetical protein
MGDRSLRLQAALISLIPNYVVVSKDAFDNNELVASIAAQAGIPVAVIALPVFLAS